MLCYLSLHPGIDEMCCRRCTEAQKRVHAMPCMQRAAGLLFLMAGNRDSPMQLQTSWELLHTDAAGCVFSRDQVLLQKMAAVQAHCMDCVFS